MGFIQIKGGNEVQEPEVAPEDTYLLSISRVDDANEKENGNVVIPVRLEFMEHPEYQGFREWLVIPGSQAEPKARQFMILKVRRFCHAFGVSFDDGFDPAELVGQSAELAVTQEEVKTDSGGFITNRLVVPRMDNE